MTKDKISTSNLRRIARQETREDISKSLKGRKRSEVSIRRQKETILKQKRALWKEIFDDFEEIKLDS